MSETAHRRHLFWAPHLDTPPPDVSVSGPSLGGLSVSCLYPERRTARGSTVSGASGRVDGAPYLGVTSFVVVCILFRELF